MTTRAPTAKISSPRALSREQVLARLFTLFRHSGFEGVSLSDIAAATGLGKSSLYHHFPGGKTDMAEAVLAFAGQWTQANVLAPLLRDRPRADRIDGMITGVRRLYQDGDQPCIVASMLVGGRGTPIEATVSDLLRGWIDTLARALVETGAAEDTARAAATDAVVRIQGSLIVARALSDTAAFESALARARTDLLAA